MASVVWAYSGLQILQQLLKSLIPKYLRRPCLCVSEGTAFRGGKKEPLSWYDELSTLLLRTFVKKQMDWMAQ